LSGHLLGDVLSLGLEAAKLSQDVLHVLPALPADAGPLLDDPRVAVVSFTGGASTGWKMRERAARKQVLLELGGDAAGIVWGDADLDAAAKKCATSAFAYAGQVCIKLQRLYVHEKVAERFIEALLRETRALPVGDPRDPKTVVGPLIDDASADRVTSWIDEAVKGGAKPLLSGPRQDRILHPTILTNAPKDAKVSCEEIFGPVLLLERVSRFEDALDRVNASRYGLQACVFTRDVRRIEAAFERLEVGGLLVNDPPSWRVDTMPYGGSKASGAGREGVRWAIEDMTEPRLMVLAPDEAPDLDRT
ncbi:MAG TPA: aldehyde dehydrogenase family protein, partial [Planctomycetota bacterium]|nr:aldehyde dehydrogenase family protein [Planctomycetota bacterium]